MYNGYYVHKGKRVDSKSLVDDYVVEPQLYECGVFDNIGATKAINVTLPKALPGRRHSFYAGAAYNISIMPQATEVVSTSAGAYLGAGVGIKMGTAGTGQSVTLICRETGKWSVLYYVGSWVTT